MYRTGGHGALTLWFNIKLSPPNGLILYEKWFNVKLPARNGLMLNQIPSCTKISKIIRGPTLRMN